MGACALSKEIVVAAAVTHSAVAQSGVKKEQQIFFLSSFARTGRENGRDERATGDKGIKRREEERALYSLFPLKRDGNRRVAITLLHSVLCPHTENRFDIPHLTLI